MKKILLIGPLPDPITGLSMANKTVIEGVKEHRPEYKVDYINTSYHSLENQGVFSIGKLLFYSKSYIKLYKIFSNNYIYITPGQTFFGVVKYAPFIFLSKILRKQVVVHIHGNHLHKEYKDSSNFKKKLMHKVLSKVDKGIVLSESLYANMTPFISKDNIYHLYNFVENELLESGEKYSTDKLKILYLSNLIPSKGIFDLLKAACILKDNNIPFELEVAGHLAEEEKEAFNQYQDKLGDNINFLGIVRGEDKKNAFIKSNVFVFPTYYPPEGQPISILEAMATGNIVLTTKHAGIPDIFKDGENGYYVDKKNPESIASKLKDLSDKLYENQKISDNNIKTALEKYTVKMFINNLIDILEK